MSDDLEYLHARLPDYRSYAEERARHDSDMRVRAFVGNILSEVQVRLAGTFDGGTAKILEDVLFRCIFTDQVFIRKFEHARLDEAMISSLVRSDRTLVELAERARTVAAADLRALLVEIDKQYEYRRSPEPVTT